MELVGSEFRARINSLVSVWLPAKHLVEDAIMQAHDIHPRGEIILLSQHCPFTSISDIELSLSFLL